jgi:ABC-type branched-subunit amino acid transport system ATPase component
VSLVVRDLTVRYGGLVAVDGVDLEAPAGELTGLIGPNGAGKTTLFNACSGLVRPAAGRIRMFDVDLAGIGPAARAQLGLGRTFQRIELFDSLTVEENVGLGREARLAGSRALGQFLARRGERAQIERAASEAIEVCGLGAIARRPCGALSTGERRLVELARALAGDFRIMMLDEPSSGLDASEASRFGAILRDVVARGTGILLVEHNMGLVLEVCDHIHVLDFGRLIFGGTPKQVAASEEVRRAYLGSAAA